MKHHNNSQYLGVNRKQLKRKRILSDLKINMGNDFNPWKVKSLEDFTCVVYSCPECERTFSTSEQFIGHAMRSHPKARDTLPDILNVQEIDPDIRCEEKPEITEKSLVNPALVEAVEVKQEPELESVEIKSEITEKAEKSLVNQDSVEVKQESKRSKRSKRAKGMYQCDICGKPFRTEGGRNNHMKTCQKCNICGKSFRTEYGRLDHLKTCQKRQYQRSKI